MAKGKVVTIVNYGMGNLRSLQNALAHLGSESVITADRKVVENAEVLILPGVGSFGQAMRNLQAAGLVDPILKCVTYNEKPFLGVCLGMQLLADEGEEDGANKGLGLIPGRVRKLSGEDIRLPHIGFNPVNVIQKSSTIFENIEEGSDFYFVHTYHFQCTKEEDILGTTQYGGEFVSAVHKKNIYGVQFHPEKSQSNGLQLLSNFLTIAGNY